MPKLSNDLMAVAFSTLALGLWGGCGDPAVDDTTAPVTPPVAPVEAPPAPPPVVEAPAPMLQAVPFWEDGEQTGKADALGPDAAKYLVLDLGEAWVPYLFTNGVHADGRTLEHAYRKTYLELAQGRFPDDLHGERAKKDKYLELYGVMPTLGVLRKRLEWAMESTCADEVDLSALETFEGHVPFSGHQTARNVRQRYLVGRKHVTRFMKAQGVETAEELDTEKLEPGEKGHLRYYLRHHARYEATKATQARLKCEGYMKRKGVYKKGALDWPTHEALAEFERRHRVYGWGYIGKNTLRILKLDTRMAEREAVLRVLTERAMHSYRAIEDGSAVDKDGNPLTYTGADGQQHPVPNLEADLRAAIEKAFGLTDPASTLAWLKGLGELPDDGHRIIALPAPARPEYHSDNMELFVEIDRGDVWYEFPYDENGKERRQPVTRRPHTMIFTMHNGERVMLARFGTTIGGWRGDMLDETVMWKYKNSPVGNVIWQNIVSAPVWLPPDTTPYRDLLTRPQRRKPDEPEFVVHYHETGPSYASAYGLVAAYHKEYIKTEAGEYRITHDDGIRSHGSVDYMSIMRRHSHGCHRLHNHIAVRLFSFVLNHRPHERRGHYPVSFIRDFEWEEQPYHLEIKRAGYVFRLEQPVHVNVLEGRIRGDLKKPIEHSIPKYDRDRGAYMLPDGGAVIPQRDGTMIPTTPPPLPDAGVDGGAGVEGPAGDAGVAEIVQPADAGAKPKQVAIPGGGLSPVALPGLP